MLRFVTLALRMLANGVRQVGAVLLHLYDLVIFAPLWVEARFRPRDERAVRAPVIEPAQEHAFEPAPRDNADEREHREDHHFDRYGEARA
jgi:hypothetical protein